MAATNTVRLHRVLRCPPQRLYQAIGWQESLVALAQLVEPQIPD